MTTRACGQQAHLADPRVTNILFRVIVSTEETRPIRSCPARHGASAASDVVATLRDLHPDAHAPGGSRGAVWAEVERAP